MSARALNLMSLAALGVAIAASVATSVAVLAPREALEQTFSGFYTSDTIIRIANLSTAGGHVSAGYTVDVLALPVRTLPARTLPETTLPGSSASLRCGLVDTSGTLDLFAASRTTAEPGGWHTLSFDANYILPELTLGLRCLPNGNGVMTVVVRNAEVRVAPAGD
jgi:hypothetical protein